MQFDDKADNILFFTDNIPHTTYILGLVHMYTRKDISQLFLWKGGRSKQPSSCSWEKKYKKKSVNMGDIWYQIFFFVSEHIVLYTIYMHVNVNYRNKIKK